jgi:hypothetical protein
MHRDLSLDGTRSVIGKAQFNYLKIRGFKNGCKMLLNGKAFTTIIQKLDLLIG